LKILEESLLEFPGALVIVTHDRVLMERVSTVLIALGQEGKTAILADVNQWEKWIRKRPKASQRPQKTGRVKKTKAGLSYLEKKEYEGMEAAIEEAEEKQSRARQALDDPKVAAHAEKLQVRQKEWEEASMAVEALYDRWNQLESKRQD
jgi:ATP-binding cassette subfamily F protein uup